MDPAQQYTAPTADVRAAVADLMAAGVPGDGAQPLVAYHLAPGSPFGVIARNTELAVFAGDFHETQATLSHEYAPYEDISGFFVVIDTTTGMPAGSSRYVDGGVGLNPTLCDLENIGTLPEVTREMRGLLEANPRAWDLTTMEVHRKYRGHHDSYRTTGMLARMFVLAAETYDVPGLSLVASERAYQAQIRAGFPQRLLSNEVLVYPDGIELKVTWVDIRHAHPIMLDHLGKLRENAAKDPAVAQALPVLTPYIRGIATGAGYDQYLDMTPR